MLLRLIYIFLYVYGIFVLVSLEWQQKYNANLLASPCMETNNTRNEFHGKK